MVHVTVALKVTDTVTNADAVMNTDTVINTDINTYRYTLFEGQRRSGDGLMVKKKLPYTGAEIKPRCPRDTVKVKLTIAKTTCTYSYSSCSYSFTFSTGRCSCR